MNVFADSFGFSVNAGMLYIKFSQCLCVSIYVFVSEFTMSLCKAYVFFFKVYTMSVCKHIHFFLSRCS